MMHHVAFKAQMVTTTQIQLSGMLIVASFSNYDT
uniref:Uncharacterized protein n=1 Tax=Arundo donax TaxID=35708 RepID=A0A0A9GYA2_ARUDO